MSVDDWVYVDMPKRIGDMFAKLDCFVSPESSISGKIYINGFHAQIRKYNNGKYRDVRFIPYYQPLNAPICIYPQRKKIEYRSGFRSIYTCHCAEEEVNKALNAAFEYFYPDSEINWWL